MFYSYVTISVNLYCHFFSAVSHNIRIVVVKKCWRAYTTTAICKQFENPCLQSLALTKLSFRDFPLRYDVWVAPENFFQVRLILN